MMNLRNMVKGLEADLIGSKLAERWEHDEGSLKFWRASSNFVYVLTKDQRRYFLRYSFDQDRSMEQIDAELDFMQHLVRHGYPCVEPISSDNGRLIETVSTKEGTYAGVVFSRASGSSLEIDQMDEAQLERWGRSLASLHSLAKTYKPRSGKRKSWEDILLSADALLQRYPTEHEAMRELERLYNWLHSLSRTNDGFGLAHYDFQTDNVFWDANKHQFSVIDFDDSMYHWFAMDIVTALKDLFEAEGPQNRFKIKSFLRGYRSVLSLDDEMAGLFPKFLRFDQLYGFTRLLRSLENCDMENPPAWYDGLNIKLQRAIHDKREGFRKPW